MNFVIVSRGGRPVVLCEARDERLAPLTRAAGRTRAECTRQNPQCKRNLPSSRPAILALGWPRRREPDRLLVRTSGGPAEGRNPGGHLRANVCPATRRRCSDMRTEILALGILLAAIDAGPRQAPTLSLTDDQRLQGSVNVRDFAARGDGTTDDTKAIRSAAAAASAAKATLFFPPGTYRVTQSIDFGAAQAMRIVGSGAGY